MPGEVTLRCSTPCDISCSIRGWQLTVEPVMRNEHKLPNRPGKLAALIASALLAGCAASPAIDPAPPTAQAERNAPSPDMQTTAGLTQTDVECHYEKTTGSHMIQTVCTTAEQRRETQAAAKQWMRSSGRSGGVSTVRDPADPMDNDDND